MAIGQVQFRRDTEANLKAANATLLAAGEVGFAEDKNYFAIGDGSTVFALLPIYEPSPVLYDKISGAPNLSLYVTNAEYAQINDTFQTKELAAIISVQNNVIFSQIYATISANYAVHDTDITELDARVVLQEAKIVFSGNYADLINKPVLFNGDYAALINKPVLFNGDYAALINKPALFNGVYANLTGLPVLFNGDYAALINKPVIPAAQQSVDWNATTGNMQVLNKPVIPVLPGVNNQTTFTSQATVPLVAQITVGTAKLFKIGTAAPRWYANDAGVIRAL